MKIVVAIGTRPEAIKLAPLVRELQARPGVDVQVCATAQHRQMLDQVLDLFGIAPDFDLDLMAPNQTLAGLTARIVASFDEVLAAAAPDVVVVQGDTTTTFACSLAAFYRRVRVAHVEAGLRTGDRHSPFPEEVNRRLTSVLTDWHFAPTERGRAALLAEDYPDRAIHVVGNTVIDALLEMVEQVRGASEGYAQRFGFLPPGARMVLITCHRRENFGGGLQAICDAIGDLAKAYPETHFVYPVHLNPNVQGPVNDRLGSLANVHLIPPQDYLNFIWLMDRAHIVLTDSGGVQEEAPSLGKPVVVMRDTTERMEAIEAGTALLVGSDTRAIVNAARGLLDSEAEWRKMASIANPFGDGHSCARIADILTAQVHQSAPAGSVETQAGGTAGAQARTAL
ncbi:MAG TPA: UDP-N-acetylglucosamine 2-epimerase (non-hydrolyzing) [Allosphingosinicella sp.]